MIETLWIAVATVCFPCAPLSVPDFLMQETCIQTVVRTSTIPIEAQEGETVYKAIVLPKNSEMYQAIFSAKDTRDNTSMDLYIPYVGEPFFKIDGSTRSLSEIPDIFLDALYWRRSECKRERDRKNRFYQAAKEAAEKVHVHEWETLFVAWPLTAEIQKCKSCGKRRRKITEDKWIIEE